MNGGASLQGRISWAKTRVLKAEIEPLSTEVMELVVPVIRQDGIFLMNAKMQVRGS